MSTTTHTSHGNLHHPAPFTPIHLQRLQQAFSGAQNRQSFSSFSEQSQATLVDPLRYNFNKGYQDPPRSSYKARPVRPVYDAHARTALKETQPPLDYSLCAEASQAYDDLGALASAQVHPSTARKIGSADPRHIHALVRDYAHALMVYHTALELHRTTSRVLSNMGLQRDLIFGPGVWIQEHFESLNEAQRAAAEDAMSDWDDEYAENWPLIVQSLTVLEA